MRSSSVVGSRSVALRRHEPPPTSRAESASLRTNRPPRSGRAISVSTSAPKARRNVSSLPIASGNSSASTISAGGRRPRTRDDLPPLARPQARRPSGPNRSATAPPGSPASCPTRFTPSSCSSARRRGSIGTSSSGSGARKSRSRSSETTKICPGRATFAAAKAANRRCAAPARGSQAVPTAVSARSQRRLEPAVQPLHPTRLEVDAADSGRIDRRTPCLRVHARSLPTPARPRQGPARRGRAPGRSRAPSPSRMPGRTPSRSASAVTGPSRGSVPATGDSAAGRSARPGCLRSAARNSKPGMRRQAIMGTYVLHEHLFPCQGESLFWFWGSGPGKRRRDIPACQTTRSPGFPSLGSAVKGSLEPCRKRSTHACQSAPCSAPDPCRRGHHPPRHGGRCGRCRPSGRPALAWALQGPDRRHHRPGHRQGDSPPAEARPPHRRRRRRAEDETRARPLRQASAGQPQASDREQGLGRGVASVPARRARLSLRAPSTGSSARTSTRRCGASRTGPG